jgi:hypothetical protein
MPGELNIFKNIINYSIDEIFNIITSNPYNNDTKTETICDDIIIYINNYDPPLKRAEALNSFNAKIYEKYKKTKFDIGANDVQYFKLSNIEHINIQVIETLSSEYEKNLVTPIFTISDLRNANVHLDQLIKFNINSKMNPVIMKDPITLENIIKLEPNRQYNLLLDEYNLNNIFETGKYTYGDIKTIFGKLKDKWNFKKVETKFKESRKKCDYYTDGIFSKKHTCPNCLYDKTKTEEGIKDNTCKRDVPKLPE